MDRKWWTLITVSVATFMLLLDITVVNTALPAIEEDLNASFTDLQWVIDAYTLSLAALVLTAGSLADRLGRRRVFGVGLGIFTVASLAAGLATDPTMLNIDRAIQGIGGAIMFAVSLALIAQEFAAGRERAMAMATYGATIGIAVAIGPLVGGALTDGLGWRSVFLLNVPIGIAAVAMTFTKLRESRDPNATTIDWRGPGHLQHRPVPARAGAAARQPGRLGQRQLIARPVRRRRGAAGGFVAIERRVSEPMLPLAPVPQPRVHRRPDRGLRRLGLAVRAVPVPDAVPAELPRLHPARGRAPLPADHGRAFLVAPVAGALIGRVHARVLLAVGLAMAGGGLLLMAGIQASSELDGPAARLHRRRHRRRPPQPGYRRRRAQRRPEGAQRHGGGHQRHLPPGRHRGRHRRLGRALPRPRRRQGLRTGGRNAGGRRRPPASADRSGLLRQPRPGAQRGAAGARGRSSPTQPAKGSSRG